MATSTQRPIIAALETTFTPPAACFTSLEAYTDWDTVFLVPLAITAPATAYYSCFPSGYSAFLASNPGKGSVAFYSPGICPSGFTSACTVTSNSLSGESAALCCPSDYGCFAGAASVYASLSCSSTIVSTTVVPHYTPNISAPGAWQSVGKVTLPTDGTSLVLGYGIQVRWQSSDLSVFAGATRTGVTSTTSTGSGNTAAASSTSISSDAVKTAAPSSGGISSGTKIALGLGIPIVAILLGLIVAALILIRRRKHVRYDRDDKRSGTEPDGGDTAAHPAELQGDGEMIPPEVELNARTPSPVEIDGVRAPSPNSRIPRRPPPVGSDSGYGSAEGSQRLVSSGQRVSDTYTSSPVGSSLVSSTVSSPPAAHPYIRRVRHQSEPRNSPVSPANSDNIVPHQRTSSRGSSSTASGPPTAYSATRENRHKRSGSGSMGGSDTRTVSLVDSNGGDGNAASLVRRSSTKNQPPPVPPIPPAHQRGHSGSRTRRGSDARTSSLERTGGPVSSPPSSVRRPSTDQAVARRPVPPKGAVSEASSGVSEEEREVAERYRMFTTFGS